MSFGSLEHLLQRTSSGYSVRTEYGLTVPAAFTAGRWYDFSTRMFSDRNAWSGTALTWTTCDELTGNGIHAFGIPHGGNVSPSTKHLINAAAVGNSTTALGNLLLVDLQGYWPEISTNTTSTQNLSGTPSLRYTNGEGCQLYFVSTGIGATPQDISISYTNQAGTSGRSLLRTVSMTPSAIATHIAHSGTAANNFGPFLPLSAGDYGVQNVASVTFSAASGAGTGALCLARPIMSIPITTAYTMTEKDLITTLPSLPQIKEGACLVWLFYTYAATAINSGIHGYLDFAWG